MEEESREPLLPTPAKRGKWDAATWDVALRVGCLLLLVVQNSSIILVTSYSRTLQPPYSPTVAVFLAEVQKVVAAFALLAWEQRSPAVAARQTLGTVREYGWETVKFAVPAMCYTLQNNLWYYALSNLDPVTAAVTSQMKVRRSPACAGAAHRLACVADRQPRRAGDYDRGGVGAHARPPPRPHAVACARGANGRAGGHPAEGRLLRRAARAHAAEHAERRGRHALLDHPLGLLWRLPGEAVQNGSRRRRRRLRLRT